MIDGPELFCRYAQAPNLLGYCGPDNDQGVTAVAAGLTMPVEEMTRIGMAFNGAWPYLELISKLSGHHPLDHEVVEAYWLGSPLLDQLDLVKWGSSAADRFYGRAGPRWAPLADALNSGGVPNHAFHVFCAYPWVGLLGEGFVGPSLEVLDRCRIGWGVVTEVDDQMAIVRRRPLVWVDDVLRSGDPVVEPFRAPAELAPGDHVSLHWDFVCQRLDRRRLARLRAVHDRHLAIANAELTAHRLEPSH